MKEISISRFKATCLKLLQQVKRTGKPLLVTRRGEPVAEVIPPPSPEPAEPWLGSGRGSGKILGDIVSPLPAEDWEANQP